MRINPRLSVGPLLFVVALMMAPSPAPAQSRLSSPNGRVTVDVSVTRDGLATYAVRLDDVVVLRPSPLGLVRGDGDFSTGLSLEAVSPVTTVTDRYELLTNKKRVASYRANRRTWRVRDARGRAMELVFQVSDDGVAFRYVFPEAPADGSGPWVIDREATGFRLPETARGWLQPVAEARTGWAKTNPSYEEYWEMDVAVGGASPTGAGWAYPALFRASAEGPWVLVSEVGFQRDYCGTRLVAEGGGYRVGFPDPRESRPGGAVKPTTDRFPWRTPWRIVGVGDLATIVASTLGTDVAEPAVHGGATDVEPGKASWSWVLLKDGQTNFETQKRFVDYAADMGWRYCLVDSLWDRQIGEAKMRELVAYADRRGVEILVWYNSAGSWNESFQTPRDKLLTHEGRIAEFERMKALGVAGLKVDFFGGDGQSMMAYYRDILDDAAPYGLHMNFHGCTLPRGLHRTYPYLMTVEAIRGMEFITFDQRWADRAAEHATMPPFTRNVFDPMDYTPTVLDRIPGIERRTTSAFELALAVLYVSGIQHYAETPEGMAQASEAVRRLMREIPSVWEDVRLIDGFPGEHVVIARRGGGRWYVAGINGTAEPLELSLDVPGRGGSLYRDGEGPLGVSVERWTGKRLEVRLPARGGFVLQMDPPTGPG